MSTHEALSRYYRLHAGIYDATRWSFLFGREALLRRLPPTVQPSRILEVGCGTGRNLASLARLFPEAELTGIDLSAEMLTRARQRLQIHGDRVHLEQQAYGQKDIGQFDLIIASYALSMFNPGWNHALDAMRNDLAPNGRVALVDFHDSPLPAFQQWMQLNHVRMEGHLRPRLNELFSAEIDEVKSAYAGVWRYLMFVGRAP